MCIQPLAGLNKKFTVAVAALNGRVQPSADLQPQFGAAVAQALFYKFKMHRIAHNAALADLTRLQLKLRLDQHQQITAGLEQTHHGRQDQRERDERQVTGEKVKHRFKVGVQLRQQFGLVFQSSSSFGGVQRQHQRTAVMLEQIGGRERTRVHAFDAHHTCISAQAGVQLTMTDIHTDHLCCALLQQAVRETAGGLTHIQTAPTGHCQTRALECAFELEPATRDVLGLGRIRHHQLGTLGNFVAVLGHLAPGRIQVSAPLHARCDQALRLRSGRGHATVNKEKVCAHRWN